MNYYNYEFTENSFLQEYKNYSAIEKLTCILTLALNDDLFTLNFGVHTHAI